MIDLRLRKPGEIIYVETEVSLWEMEVQDRHGIVVVDSTDLRVRGKKRAQYAGAVTATRERPFQIIKGWCFLLNFADCGFVSAPVTSATIKGKDWEYEVF